MPSADRRGLHRSVAWLGLLVLTALAAPWLSPHAPTAQLDLLTLNSRAPSWAHPFGTDAYSRDVFSRVLHGARISLFVGLAAAALNVGLAGVYGAGAALAGGGVERAMRRLLEVGLSVPRVLVLLAVTAFWDQLSVPSLVFLLGATGWFPVARIVADATAALVRQDFVVAARATGVPALRLLRMHLIPHLVPLLSVSATFEVANAIALETGLSYLGLGLQPPTASWGTILHDGASTLGTSWWLTVFPGLATVLTVLACHALGDALRDLFAADHVATGSTTTLLSPVLPVPPASRP